jgi:5'-phosphate synthase pdxT subunit
VGVLSYQGGFQKHLERFQAMGVSALPVRDPETLSRVDALGVPGGESTTIGMLMERFGVLAALRERVRQGLPVFGTCAGAILLATDIESSDQPRIGAIDMTVRRNAYGRQIDSFEADAAALAGPSARSASAPALHGFHGVFIRAPQIVRLGSDVEPILEFEGKPVLVRSGRLLAATFHPELTPDDRIHRYFVDLIVSG